MGIIVAIGAATWAVCRLVNGSVMKLDYFFISCRSYIVCRVDSSHIYTAFALVFTFPLENLCSVWSSFWVILLSFSSTTAENCCTVSFSFAFVSVQRTVLSRLRYTWIVANTLWGVIYYSQDLGTSHQTFTWNMAGNKKHFELNPHKTVIVVSQPRRLDPG